MAFTKDTQKEKAQGYFNIDIEDAAGNKHRLTGVALMPSKALHEALVSDAKADKEAHDPTKGEYVPKVYSLSGSINLVDENPAPITFG